MLQLAADRACAAGASSVKGSVPSGARNTARRSVFTSAVADRDEALVAFARSTFAGQAVAVVSDDQIFHAVWYVGLLLMVLAAAVPLARSRRSWLRHAAWGALIGGFLFALYRVFEWASD